MFLSGNPLNKRGGRAQASRVFHYVLEIIQERCV